MLRKVCDGRMMAVADGRAVWRHTPGIGVEADDILVAQRLVKDGAVRQLEVGTLIAVAAEEALAPIPPRHAGPSATPQSSQSPP